MRRRPLPALAVPILAAVVAAACLSAARSDAATNWSVPLTGGAVGQSQSASLIGPNSPASGTNGFGGVDVGASCDWEWGSLAGGTPGASYYEIDTLGGSVVSATAAGSVGAGSELITPTQESTVYRLRTRLGSWSSTNANSLEGACDASGLQSISVGYGETGCAIRASDQSLWCWGLNLYDTVGSSSSPVVATSTPQEISTTGTQTWRQVSSGDGDVCAIKTDGTLWCWGNNTYGSLGNGSTVSTYVPTQVGTATTWSQVSVSAFGACATQTGNQLYCWGLNNFGQVGNGTTTSASNPTQISGSWDSVSRFVETTCGIKTDGTLWCWGGGGSGNLGNGTTTGSQLTPVQAGSATTWAHVSVGSNATCATQTNGSLWCWGDNTYGEVGDGTTTRRATPVQVGSSLSWASISSGYFSECGTQTDGSVWCWGYNDYGQLGNGNTTNQSSPVEVANDGAGDEVTDGYTSACALATTGSATCWGDDNYGELGIGTTMTYDAPNQAGTGTAWAVASEGYQSGCAIQTAGTLWCWGGNGLGEVGNGGGVDQESPVQIGSSTWSQVSTGIYDSCAIQTSGTLWCWGYGAYGQLGDGSTASVTTPNRVGTATTWAQVSQGYGQTCAVQTNHTLWCWGLDGNSQLGDGATTNQTTPEQIDSGLSWASVSAGVYATCAITTGGALYCWGYNGSGQLGVGNLTNQTTPQQVDPGVTDWSRVSEPGAQTCATRTDGSLWCWGLNSWGEVGDGTTTSHTTPVQIDAGVTTWSNVTTDLYTTCATRTDGTLWCWGYNLDGTVGDGTTTQRNSPVQVGATSTWTEVTGVASYTMCGLASPGSLWCWGDASSGGAADGVTRNTTSPGTAVLGGAIWNL